MLRVSRVENKYLISYSDYVYLRGVLSSLMQFDRGEKYWIRSLYFDDTRNRDWNEKIVGEFSRQKIRLRTYDCASNYAKFEIKSKEGIYSKKDSVELTADDASLIVLGNFEVLKKYDKGISDKVFKRLVDDYIQPVVMIDYYREAYYLPINNVRITFDGPIYATKSSDFFNRNILTVPITESGKMVLEIKYNGFLPRHIMNAISSIDLTNISVSKYCLGREILY